MSARHYSDVNPLVFRVCALHWSSQSRAGEPAERGETIRGNPGKGVANYSSGTGRLDAPIEC